MKKILCILFTVFYLSSGFGQDIEIEKTYEISGKADIGDVANVSYDQNTGQSVYSFIVKSKSDLISIESYSFDKDFNFLKNDADQLTFEQAKKKYPWWNYNGEHLESDDLIVDESDDIVLLKKKFEFDYDWKKLVYTVKSDVKDKIKLKNDAGSKYVHHRNWIPEDENNVIILCGERSKSDKLLQDKTFHLIKINDADVSISKDVEIKFDYPQTIVYPRFNDEKTEGRGCELEKDIILVFAPRDEGAKFSDPQKNNFTFMRIDKDLNITDRISFSSPNSFWSVEDPIYDQKQNSVYLIGASLGENAKYFNDLTNTDKFDGFQIMKISDHKIGFINSVSQDEINKNIVMPPSQKKAKKYEGKKFIIAEYTVTSEGYLFLVGQSWYTDAMGTMSNLSSSTSLPGKKSRKIKYSDCFGLGFDTEGRLIGQYLFDTKGMMGGNDFSVYQYLFVGNNPATIYWLILQPVYWTWNPIVQVYDYRPVKQPSLSDFMVRPIDYIYYTPATDFNPLYFINSKIKCDIVSANLGKIDLSKNKISEFNNHQYKKEEKKFYYLCPGNPLLLTNDNKLIFFGSQAMKKGKTLWFARLRLD